jgi:hypothetical protein
VKAVQVPSLPTHHYSKERIELKPYLTAQVHSGRVADTIPVRTSELACQLTGANWNSRLFFHLTERFTGYSKLISYSQDARCPALFEAFLSWLKGLSMGSLKKGIKAAGNEC